MEEVLNSVLDEFKVSSEEELLNNHGTKDFYLKAKEGIFTYEELISLGYLNIDDIVKTIGIEKSLSEGIISEEEAKQIKKEGISSGINLDEL